MNIEGSKVIRLIMSITKNVALQMLHYKNVCKNDYERRKPSKHFIYELIIKHYMRSASKLSHVLMPF